MKVGWLQEEVGLERTGLNTKPLQEVRAFVQKKR
jgi:hypothetical protein